MEFCHRHDNDFKSVKTFILRQLWLPFFCLLTIFYLNLITVFLCSFLNNRDLGLRNYIFYIVAFF